VSYANARNIFPREILEIIQQYVDDDYIYIPKKEDKIVESVLPNILGGTCLFMKGV
jgi:hypothetical protein